MLDHQAQLKTKIKSRLKRSCSAKFQGVEPDISDQEKSGKVSDKNIICMSVHEKLVSNFVSRSLIVRSLF